MVDKWRGPPEDCIISPILRFIKQFVSENYDYLLIGNFFSMESVKVVNIWIGFKLCFNYVLFTKKKNTVHLIFIAMGFDELPQTMRLNNSSQWV